MYGYIKRDNMKILYLNAGDHVDYQDDCLLIGLKELFGSDVVDYNKKSHVYDTFCSKKAKTMYGKGMTVTRVLPDLDVDRNDITSKIKNNFFDIIIYGSVWRCNKHIESILKYYPSNRVILIDGEDETDINKHKSLNLPYFKRELKENIPGVYPIAFSMPTSKVSFNKENKNRDLAICDPRYRSTYIYDNEADYYKGYREARFGVTMKKAGWDCMRHYEILGNGCLPIFLGIEHCPATTMTTFPKTLCISLNNDLSNKKDPNLTYLKYVNAFQEHFLEKNTTLAAAKSFIDTVNSLK